MRGEREYLIKLCQERGIEVEFKSDKRDNLSLSKYKVATRKVEGPEVEAEKLDRQNVRLRDQILWVQKMNNLLHFAWPHSINFGL